MGFYADIYVIKKSRSKELGIKFLDHFIPQRTASADEYCIPQYSDHPQYTFEDPYELMEYLENNKSTSQSIYFRCLDKENPNQHGMLFYTSDGCMIFGISRNADTDNRNNTSNEDECLEQLKQFFDTNNGYITYECPPEDTWEEFLVLCE